MPAPTTFRLGTIDFPAIPVERGHLVDIRLPNDAGELEFQPVILLRIVPLNLVYAADESEPKGYVLISSLSEEDDYVPLPSAQA